MQGKKDKEGGESCFVLYKVVREELNNMFSEQRFERRE